MSDHDASRADAASVRPIRSFVRRQGRITRAQQRALDTLWPRYGLATDEALDEVAAFGRHAPLTLEIGFGNGESLLYQARERPDGNFIGVEVHRPGVGRLLMALDRENIGNVRVYCADAVDVLRHCIGAGSLSTLQIYFPDPWPKKRHHKRRLIQPEFALLAASRLRPGGRWLLATDWLPYAEHMRDVLDACPLLDNLGGADGFTARPPERLLTRFEARGERKGHRVYDLAFRRRPG